MPGKVTYFPLPALGEPIRLLLAYGDTEFENVVIALEQWSEFKTTFPFGQLPVYEEDGKIANQTLAICRYLGKKFNLAGDNDWENLEIDAIADTINDFIQKIIQFHYETSAKTKEAKKEALEEALPFYQERLEKIAKENNGHLAAKKLTWVDFYFAGLEGYYSLAAKRVLTDGYPNLTAAKEAVLKLPSTIKFYEKNPINMEAVLEFIRMTGTPSIP